MKREKFIKELEDTLGLEDGVLDVDKNLSDYERWDSLSMLSMLDLYDELEIDVDVSELEECKKVNDLLKLARF